MLYHTWPHIHLPINLCNSCRDRWMRENERQREREYPLPYASGQNNLLLSPKTTHHYYAGKIDVNIRRICACFLLMLVWPLGKRNEAKRNERRWGERERERRTKITLTSAQQHGRRSAFCLLFDSFFRFCIAEGKYPMGEREREKNKMQRSEHAT